MCKISLFGHQLVLPRHSNSTPALRLVHGCVGKALLAVEMTCLRDTDRYTLDECENLVEISGDKFQLACLRVHLWAPWFGVSWCS